MLITLLTMTIFQLNYVKTLEKPELKCNGKCHLKKELANEAKKDNPKSNEQKSNVITFEVLYCENITSYVFNPKIYIE